MSQTNYWPSVELQPKISWRCNAMLRPRVAAAAPAAPAASRGGRATSPQSNSDRKCVSTQKKRRQVLPLHEREKMTAFISRASCFKVLSPFSRRPFGLFFFLFFFIFGVLAQKPKNTLRLFQRLQNKRRRRQSAGSLPLNVGSHPPRTSCQPRGHRHRFFFY